jgi:dTDP-4-amino-4,6-dideoxygalactose transaminase
VTETVVPLARPFTTEEELQEVHRVLQSGHLSQGAKVVEFERMVAAQTGARHAFATSSCTTALHISLVVLGIGEGDEILVPDFTFPATANVVVQQGAVPVLVDVQLDTYNIDPEDLARHLSPRTKAILPVHLFGLSADMGPVLAFAAEQGLAVVEDAACALGATYHGRPCGSMADLGCFSFHPRKIVTTGEGGMVVTDRDDLAEKLQLLRSHGGVRRNDRFTFEEAGFNYRLSDVQAAIGTAQMRRLQDMVERRRRLAFRLSEELAGVVGITVPGEPAWGGHVYQAFVALVDPDVDRDAVIAGLRRRGIEATIGTYALHAQPFFRRRYGYRVGQVGRSHSAFLRSIALPLYPHMQDAELEAVVDGVRAAVAESTVAGSTRS